MVKNIVIAALSSVVVGLGIALWQDEQFMKKEFATGVPLGPRGRIKEKGEEMNNLSRTNADSKRRIRQLEDQRDGLRRTIDLTMSGRSDGDRSREL